MLCFSERGGDRIVGRTTAFHLRPDPDWNRLWLLMWVVTTPTWIAIAFIYPISEAGNWWIAPAAFLLLFLVPEIVSIRRGNDKYPPLTHTIRHFIPDDLTFPLIYFLVGAVGGRWFGFPVLRFLGLGAMFAILGWLTIHFTLSYIGPDPGAPKPRRHADPERSRYEL
jgi:hypothetical protein